MRGRLFAALLLLATASPSFGTEPPVPATTSVDRLREAGLDRAWLSHADVDSAFGHVIDMQIAVDTKRTTTRYAVIVDAQISTQTYSVRTDAGVEQRERSVMIGGRLDRLFSELDLGPRGTPYGIDGAKAAAELRVEVLAAEGKSAMVREEVLPKITLFVLTDQYVVEAIDGETGASLWSARAGKRGAAINELAVSADHVVVANGMDLFCLDALTGLPVWTRRSEHSPGAGAAITNWFVYVPMLNGSLEAFPLHRPEARSQRLLSSGRAMTRPILTSERIVWANEQKTLFIASRGAEVSPMEFRVRFDQFIATDMATDGRNSIFVPMSDGVIHAVSDRQGQLIWKQSLGDPMHVPPVYVDGDLYAVTVAGTLFSLDPTTGITRWQARGIERVISVSATKVYALDRMGILHAFERQGGRKVGSVDLAGATVAATNTLTDRIYVATPSGRLECLHELDVARSVLHGSPELVPNRPAGEPVEAAPAPVRAAPAPPEPAAPAAGYPFGTGR
ncbi:MAG TPA: PQQ-binding-like beta-propeller repeat protein [Pirellulaceae bacterium]|nr:PQQ-binding-like beta-propeller repeat protein [Pirellulaceae bacterium]